VKRGEIWTIAGGPNYAGKPRPAIILQSDRYDGTESVTLCPLTAGHVEVVYARFPIEPTAANGLKLRSYVMVDKITTLPRSKVGYLMGRLSAADLSLLERRVVLFLGLADPK
jgi:mRNA interferase MazF